MRYNFLFLILVLLPLLFTANSSKAAVPTFDVGLNPKMDELLIKTEDIRVMTRRIECMIANLHRKEYGPPPPGVCSSSSSLGLGSLGSAFNTISSIVSNVAGGIFDNASGPAIDTGNQSTFDWSQDVQQWGAPDSAGNLSTFDWNQDAAQWDVTDSAGNLSTFDWNQDAAQWDVADSAGNLSTFDWNQDAAQWDVTDSAGNLSTFDWNQDAQQWDVTDSAGNLSTFDWNQDAQQWVPAPGSQAINPSVLSTISGALKNVDSIKSIVRAIGAGDLSVFTRSIDSLIGRAASIFGACDSLDCMARKMAEMAQGFLQQQILSWIRTGAVTNSGRSGAPLFVRDWDRYLLDAANYASSVFLGELQGTRLCEPFGSELKRIFSTGGGFSVGAISGGGFGGGASSGSGGSPPFNQILNCNLNSMTRNFQPFFDDFDNGGYVTFLNLTQFENNPYGQYLIVQEQAELRELRAVQAARLEAESGQGFLGDKECVEREITLPPDDDYEGGTQIYQDCPIVTPGIIQKEVTAKVAVSEQEKLQDVHEMKELFDTILRQMVQSILFSAGGLFSSSLSSTNPPSLPPPPPSVTVGTFTVLNGGWCSQGDPNQRATINQSGLNQAGSIFNVVLGTGQVVVGSFQSATTISVPDWSITGTINTLFNRIDWDTNTNNFWTRC